MRTKAVIDVGTNSFKLLVMSFGEGEPRVLCDLVEVVRLGEGTAESRRLEDESMERALGAICEMARSAHLFGADEIVAVGTQALREAENAQDFIERVRDGCQVEIQRISGEEEAALSFDAVLFGSPEITRRSPICLFDVGGGSSEIVCGDTAGIRSRRSLPVGALALHNGFFKGLELVSEEVIRDARMRVRSLLEEAPPLCSGVESAFCVGVGGTITTLASVMLALSLSDWAQISGAQISVSEIERQIAVYASTPIGERPLIKGLNPKRADIILAGACIVCELLIFHKAEELIVSDCGLRYGVMKKYFG